MKNLHLISTEKPSRLFNCFGKLEIGDYTTIRENLQVTNQHIFITSDEEIKEGDWVTNGLGIMKANLDGQPAMDDYHPWKKIILTTDQDLIKDGVQPIDDDFLEWFVKNPSCEEVEIEMEWKEVMVNGYKNQPKDVIGFVLGYEMQKVPKLDSNGCLILKPKL